VDVEKKTQVEDVLEELEDVLEELDEVFQVDEGHAPFQEKHSGKEPHFDYGVLSTRTFNRTNAVGQRRL
jgi:hypothetical protein